MITIRINGESHQFAAELTVDALIADMGLTGKRVALERNGDIVPRSQFTNQVLSDGDRLEIVTAVGGG